MTAAQVHHPRPAVRHLCLPKPSPLTADDNNKAVDNPVFHCPAEPDRVNNCNFTYGYNFQFLGTTRNKLGTATGMWNPINFPVRISRINAVGTVLAADAMGTAAGKPRDQRKGYRNDGSADLFALGNHASSLDPPRLTAGSDYCDDNNRAAEHRSAPEERHKKRANVAFADGHVEALTLKELGYIVLPDGTVTANGAGATNKMFSGNGTDKDPPAIN